MGRSKFSVNSNFRYSILTKTFSFELPTQVPAEADSDGNTMPTDLKSLLAAVYRRFWLIALSFLAVFSLVAYMTFTATPLYTAKATVIVDTKERNCYQVCTGSPWNRCCQPLFSLRWGVFSLRICALS